MKFPIEVSSNLKSLIETAEESTSHIEIRALAKAAFAVSNAPITDDAVEVLLTSVKDYNRIPSVTPLTHVLRCYFAHRIAECHARTSTAISSFPEDYRHSGVVAIPNFYKDGVAEDILEIIDTFECNVPKNAKNMLISIGHKYPVLNMILHEDTHLRYLLLASLGVRANNIEALNMFKQNTFVQRLHNKEGDGDVQKILHMDTFFPTLKFWYFPHEVTLDGGPFVYAKGSNKLSPERLLWIYEQSQSIVDGKIEPERTYGHAEGSLRILPHELESMGLKESAIAVPANTLVVGNTFGFHRRSEPTGECFRSAIHGSIRTSDPFA